MLVKSHKVIRNVISNLAINLDEDTIRNNVSVTTVSDAEVIEISVKNEDPVLAAKITNEMSKVFIENVKEYYGMENVHIVDEAEVAQGPCNVNHVKDIIIFAFVGVVIAVMYVLIANMLDTTIKSEEELEKLTGFTVLAAIPFDEKYEDKKGGRRK